MLYQVDYKITRQDSHVAIGEHSRIIEAKDINDAERKFKDYIGYCEYKILEIFKL